MSRLWRYWPFLFLGVCAFAPLWRAFLLGENIGPFDHIRQSAPWSGPVPERPWDVLQADGVLQFYPWRDMVFDSWGRLELPAWNPYELAGTPLLASSQSAGLYPPHIFMGVLHIPTPLAMKLLAWLHLLWAGLGVYMLSRNLGAIKTGAALAGAGFCLSSFMLSWTGLPSVISTVAWIPWMLWSAVALFAAGGKIKFKYAVLLALCTGMMLLAGHLQFCAYGLAAVAFLALWLSISKKQLAALALSVAGLLLGGLLSAPQLLPVLNYGKFSHRSNTPTEQGYAGYVQRAIPLSAIQSLAFPTALGNPTKPTSIRDPQLKQASQYWPAITNPGMNFAETAIGVGPLLFILLFFSRRLKGAPAALLALGTVSLLVGLGTPLNKPLYFMVPGWSATGSPGRALVLFVLASCVLAGLALGSLDKFELKPLQASAVLLGMGGLLLALAPIIFGIQYSPVDAVQNAVKLAVFNEFPTFMLTLVISICAILLSRSMPKYLWAAPVAAAVCAFLAYGNFIPTSESTLATTTASPTERYAFINSHWGLLTPTRNLMPPNTASLSRIHELGGYDSLLHRDSVNLLQIIDGQNPSPPINGNMMFVRPTADPKEMSDAGVTEVWSLTPMPALGVPESIDGNAAKYRLKGKGRAFTTPGGPAQIQSESYGSLTLQALGPGTLTVKDRMMPGWTALVDGSPAPIGGGLWRTVQLPPGIHKVVFSYEPPGFTTGLLLCVVAGLVLFGLIILARFRLPKTG